MNAKSDQVHLLQKLIRDSRSRYHGIYRLRSEVDDEKFFRIFQKFFPHKWSLNDYHGTAFPKSAQQLFSAAPPKIPTTAFKEVLWATARCLQFTSEIRKFVILKERFEVLVLNDSYLEAAACLYEIEGKFGKSIWLYQNQLACAYLSDNDNDPSDIAQKINDEVKGNPILPPLLHYLRRRIEGASLREKVQTEITDAIKDELIREYFLAKAFGQTSSSGKSVSSVLFLDSQASVIDHYSSLILVLQAALSDEMFASDMSACITGPLKRLYHETNDRRLIGILASLGHIVETDADRVKYRAAVIEAYTEERYAECIDLATIVLNTDPLDSSVRFLSIKAAVALQRQPPKISGILGRIHENLYNVLSTNDEFYRGVHALVQICDRFADHNWMLYYRVALWYEIGAEEPKRAQTWMRDIYVRDSFISPFTALIVHHEQASSIVNYLENKGLFPSTLALVKSIQTHTLTNPENPHTRELRYLAREKLANSDYSAAADFYFAAANKEQRLALRTRSLGGASLALMLAGRKEMAVNTAIGAHLANSHSHTLLPIQLLVDQLQDAGTWPETIRLGLLFSLANQLGIDNDLSKLRLSFERFCEANQIYSPSDLAEKIEEYGLPDVIDYLDGVWNPEVMRQTLLYEDPTEIEEARIEACQVLAKIDPSRARIYKGELASRIKQQEISKATELFEKSKVYVDIDAIKRSLRAKLKGSYAQYKSTIAQFDKPNDGSVHALFKALEGIDNASLPTILSNFHILNPSENTSQTDIQFSAIFGEITKEFLIGDHGLNAYLSTRVRHGKLVDALRKSVMDEHLVTARLDDGSYIVNNHWDSDIQSLIEKKNIVEALSLFSKKVDDVLLMAREKRIQIRTYYDLQPADENNEGLFQYHFSRLERMLMQSYDVDFKDLDELIVKCVDSLWEKTDHNLVHVRNYITGDLRDELISKFDWLLEEVSHQCSGLPPSALANAIARSRTATQQALENVATWFHRSEVYDRQDFEIDFPSQIAASMVNRTLSMAHSWSGPDYQVEHSDSKLPGRALDSLVDIFYALYENAAKYAESENIGLKVKSILRFNSGEFSCSVISGGLPPRSDRLAELEELRQSLETQESRRLAQTEGRSGFRKILLALSNPIYKGSDLTFDHQSNGNFVVRFGFKVTEPQ